MSEHYSKMTKAATTYCKKCGRQTMHRVDNGRLGSCLEQHFDGLSAAQRKQREKREIEDQQPKLL
jgi:ribosomal protein L44E